ncbi:PCMD domain-containing protein [Carboxylicivirga sp. A043]|uniref:PCMD domain-containing protein n=1 Tax=Carboxylicivirga linearis TaxID=1628157 RepID=A0ABS5K3E7_9BACT|nr:MULTISPECIES: PCMD domain-containing protein [Carboxylicivirga]MBS2101101.1 PCMD domain-containing protein [Carboxylicivirga linearis]MCU4158182.1 PCMD domain-containing protein [Carboxylicivirga sp. A043]
MKKNILTIVFPLLAIVLIQSCIKEDYFGLSPYGNIKDIVVSNQASNAKILTDSNKVIVEIPGGVDLSEIQIQSINLSSFAESDKKVGDILDLNTPQNITITAEDGSIHLWEVESFVASVTPQLANGDFSLWYKTASDYYEPGENASNTIWGTGNQGTQILNKLATIPEDLGADNLAAKMITLDNGKLAGTFGAPISAGSIFTGVFNPDNIDPSNPQAAIEFGTPFVGRPEKIRLKYSYVPGDENKDKTGNILDYPDACDIYALLEIRLGGKTERLATAWVRSSETQEALTTLEIPFIYGELDNSYPDYMLPSDHGFVSADSASFVLPTHITFVASSSFDGANFAGAIGSTLIIDDVEMIYD